MNTSRPDDSFEILQIIQATGWRAVLKLKGRTEQIPIACFALVRDGGLKRVIGFGPFGDDPRVIGPFECKDFLGYIGPGVSLDGLDMKPIAKLPESG